MTNSAGFDGRTLARIDDIVTDAVIQGQAPGVVAAVAHGDAIHVATTEAQTLGGARRCVVTRSSGSPR